MRLTRQFIFLLAIISVYTFGVVSTFCATPADPTTTGPGQAEHRTIPADVLGVPRTIVFVCDCTDSMANRITELKQQLSQQILDLKPMQSFNIAFYKNEGDLKLSENDLLVANPANKQLADKWLDRITVGSKTNDPVPALKFALSQRPRLIIFLCGGEGFADAGAVSNVFRTMNPDHATKVNTLLLVKNESDKEARGDVPTLLTDIAKENGGAFRLCVIDDSDPPIDPGAKAEATIEKALLYLKSKQTPDFGWQEGADPPAMSALVLKAFMQNAKYDPENPFLDKGFDKLLSFQKPDGSISNDVLTTYNTAIAVSALAISKEAEYRDQMDKALAYLRNLQWSDKIEGIPDQSKKVGPDDPNYGGFGYGRKGRADLSNTNIALDALKDAGLKPNDPAFQAALKFATRCQNNSETNDQKWAGDDGGFVYFPADGGGSPAGEYIGPDGKKMLRSYGSMTYAGLKSMMYAGLSKDDPRVKAAWKWVADNWTLSENPGMSATDPKAGDSGLFYYYHTLARALRAYGEPIIIDNKGVKHDWRLELIDRLAQIQNADGSFSGTQKWMENKPILATALATLALQEAQADLREHPPTH